MHLGFRIIMEEKPLLTNTRKSKTRSHRDIKASYTKQLWWEKRKLFTFFFELICWMPMLSYSRYCHPHHFWFLFFFPPLSHTAHENLWDMLLAVTFSNISRNYHYLSSHPVVLIISTVLASLLLSTKFLEF